MRCLIPLLACSIAGCASSAAYKSEAPMSSYGDYAEMEAAPDASAAYAIEPPDDGGSFLNAPMGGARGRMARANPAPPLPVPAPEAESRPDAVAPDDGTPRTPAQGKRLVIYTGRLSLMVASVEPAMAKLLARVEELGGYLSQRNDQTLTVRVPAKSFQGLVAEVEGMGTVLSRQVSAQDVTAQYRDLAIRIENAERSRERLLELMKRAEQMEDVLQIEAELTRVTGELESMKGQLALLADQIALSTLTVDLRSNAPPPRPVQLRRYSRFEWINRVGVENVASDF